MLEDRAGRAERGGGMGVLVGVDADDDIERRLPAWSSLLCQGE